MALHMIIRLGGQGLRRGQGLLGLSRLAQLDVAVAEPDVREGKIRIVAQCLMERSRRFNPHERMQVGKPLIVESLRFFRFCSRVVMHAADAAANGNRALQE